MKITIVSSSYPPSLWNSTGRTTYSVAQGLSGLGHAVTVITYNPASGNKFAKDKNVRIQYLGIDGSATLPIDKCTIWQDAVAAHIKKFCRFTDLFICVDSYGFKAIENSKIKASVIGLCNFLYSVTGWIQSIGANLEKQFLLEEHEFIKNCSLVLCNNKVTASHVSRKVNRDVGRYVIGIPEIKNIEHNPIKRQVLYVGKLNREKGVERILRVMPKLPWMNLVICDQNSSNSYKDIINKLAEELGVTSKITFTGFLSTQNVWKLYAESEICIVPHIAEPFGYSAIYSMTLGTPTIVSTANGLPEIVGDSGDYGAVFTNIEELRYYLDEIHQMPPIQKMYSENGRQRILEEYSIDKMIQSIVKYF